MNATRKTIDLSADDLNRFWEKVRKGGHSECWEWQGGHTYQGYGQFHVALDGGKRLNARAHRVSWMIEHGELSDDLLVDHICCNRACVNPEHLREITSGENVLCGVGPTAVNLRKTKCNSGHPFDEENTFFRSNGERRCRACVRAWAREHHAKTKACPHCGKQVGSGNYARHLATHKGVTK